MSRKPRAFTENEKLAGLIAAKKAKLGDEKFAARAPANVIQKEREQLTEMEERLVKEGEKAQKIKRFSKKIGLGK